MRDWWDEETTVSVESSFPVIERLIAARVTAALNEAAAAIEATAWCKCRDAYCAQRATVENLARIVRNHTPT